MQLPGSRILFPVVLACSAGLSAVHALGATPTFTIAAANVTLPSGGNDASSQFTLTSVDGYVGQVRVDCGYSGGMMGAKVPACGIFVNPVSTLAANKSVTGSLTVMPYGKVKAFDAVGLGGDDRRRVVPVLAAVLAGFFMLGRRWRLRARSWLLVFLAGVTLAGITSCGGGLSGTFPYTVTAVDIKTNASVSAPFTVTVP
jgi:hypothetical protein